MSALIEFLERLARLRIFPPAHRRKDQELKIQGLAGYGPVKSALIALQPYLQVVGISVFIRPSNTAMYLSVAAQVSPRNTLPARLLVNWGSVALVALAVAGIVILAIVAFSLLARRVNLGQVLRVGERQ